MARKAGLDVRASYKTWFWMEAVAVDVAVDVVVVVVVVVGGGGRV